MDIKHLESKLWDLNNEKSNISIKNHIAKGMYFVFLPVILLFTGISNTIVNGGSILTTLGLCASAAAITTVFNISMTGTFTGRKKQLNRIEKEIAKTETNLEMLKKENNNLAKEMPKNITNTINQIDRTYEKTEAKPLTKKLTNK